MESISEARQAEFKQKGLIDILPQTLFEKNRKQVIRMFKKQQGANLPKNAVGFFKGASEVPLYSSDCAYPEYQEAFFYYVFGVSEMDCYGAIDFEAEKATLFIPRLDEFLKIWITVMDKEAYEKKYPLIDSVQYVDTMEEFFNNLKPETVFVNLGVNSDSGLTTMIAEEKWYQASGAKTDTKILHNIVSESRVYKNDEEMEIMRWASKITCEAHCNVMRNVKPG